MLNVPPNVSDLIPRLARSWLVSALALTLVGCGSLQPAAETAVVQDVAQATKPPSFSAPLAQAVVGAVTSGGPGSFVYSHDPARLGPEVALACARGRAAGETHLLRDLVADLYFSEVQPAVAVGALLGGDCGKPAEIVEEMVAQGGRESLDAVMTRARLSAGTREARLLDAAAAAGLARKARLADAQAETPPTESAAYGMLYFPSAGEGGKLVTAMALNRLYEEAVPGYGIYTFVLMGRGFEKPRGEDTARYEELFRMIETYVATDAGNPGENEGPSATAHVFLIPIHPRDATAPLVDQAAFDLSEQMRRQFTQVLQRNDQARLAARLEKGAGPFLVATLEPRLLPSSPNAPSLITDLSEIGPEYVYEVVDAFDRPIAPETSGRPESLAVIRKRLLGLPVRASEGQTTGSPRAGWIFTLGPVAEGSLPRRPSMS